MENCSIVAKASIQVPSQPIIIRVLQDNGYSGSVGVEFLYENYGCVIATGGSPKIAFCGLHFGARPTLTSAFKLKWKHRRCAMNAGFFRRKDMIEYDRFQSLKKKLGEKIAVDVIGCIGHKDLCNDLDKAALRPPAEWWLGISEQGWLSIDLNFFLLDIYQSLSDLLCEKNGVELIA